MTHAAKQFGKKAYEFLRLPSTREYMEALCGIFPNKEVVYTQSGSGLLPEVGTWGPPKLAVFFAHWLDVKFAVWCDMMIEDILTKKAEVTIVKPQESAVLQAPTAKPFTAKLSEVS